MKCEKLSTCFEIVGNNTLGIYYIHWIIGYTFLVYLRENYIAYSGIVLNYIKAIILTLGIAFLCKMFKKVQIIGKIL